MSDTQSTNNEEEVNDQAQAAGPENVEAEVEVENSAEALANEWKSKAAYMAAELENMKKRFIRDRLETVKFANESLLKAMIPVLDNLSLALSTAKGAKEDSSSSPMLKSLVEGVEMTMKLFESTLGQAGVEFIKAKGEVFDPEVHEAVGQAQDPSQKDGVVAHEVQRGFKLGGRVACTAKVIVNKIS